VYSVNPENDSSNRNRIAVKASVLIGNDGRLSSVRRLGGCEHASATASSTTLASSARHAAFWCSVFNIFITPPPP
jgi:2-polyprenyl-6-methoxyphenol hydroxylase-like FAD-dependent oxidoreductase